jgi:alpha-glucosidase (family GH31 glycosyl hydrolase)
MMAWRTYQFLTKDTKYPGTDDRPFVNARSTFPGSGKYSSHSISHNNATWDDMRRSISGIMNMNLFGIPHSGADVCGFYNV